MIDTSRFFVHNIFFIIPEKIYLFVTSKMNILELNGVCYHFHFCFSCRFLVGSESLLDILLCTFFQMLSLSEFIVAAYESKYIIIDTHLNSFILWAQHKPVLQNWFWSLAQIICFLKCIFIYIILMRNISQPSHAAYFLKYDIHSTTFLPVFFSNDTCSLVIYVLCRVIF